MGSLNHSPRFPLPPYAVIASKYARHVESGEWRVIKILAAELGLSASRARDLVREARMRGFLTPTTRGRAAGSLTDKARRILEEHERERGNE